MGEIVESLLGKVRRGASTAPEGRKESHGCLDILTVFSR